MSLASDFAARMTADKVVSDAVVATAPTGWNGPNLALTVNADGTIMLSAFAGKVTVPSIPIAVMLSIRDWITATCDS